ncbi:MAG TPA: hypothetical protein VGS41_17310, partial [Chthonomonadales bacterium]|nr:hypothetical protein [Chthonomonadales bacterium]
WMDNCGAVWTNNQPSTTGAYEETGCGAKAISAGGNNIAYVDSTNTAYAAYSWNGTANRVSNVGDATNIAVSNQGILMMVTGCGAAYSNNTFSTSGWHGFTGCGDATAIATGGLYIGFINGGGTAWGATTWNGSINQISNTGDAQAISMNDMPRILMISSCNAAYAKDNVNDKNNWIGQTGCNDATAIAG